MAEGERPWELLQALGSLQRGCRDMLDIGFGAQGIEQTLGATLFCGLYSMRSAIGSIPALLEPKERHDCHFRFMVSNGGRHP